ncbi:hypothetical protein DL93DRAFT_2080939 [Clavulina sp. PMI_390]|nr:hypothetical protein DL93DRAFT_2080939 [Clavulina sp. PMI_390]
MTTKIPGVLLRLNSRLSNVVLLRLYFLFVLAALSMARPSIKLSTVGGVSSVLIDPIARICRLPPLPTLSGDWEMIMSYDANINGQRSSFLTCLH